jgi:hypothetical protein
MKKSLLLLVSIIFWVNGFSQTPNWHWARGATGGGGIEEGYSISADANGNAVITGYFSAPTISFGSYTLTTAGYGDIYVVKYNSSGNVVWATSAGGAYSDAGYGVANDTYGNVFVTGYFTDSPITFGSYTLTNAGGNDIFIVKYNPSGNVLWAASAGGATGAEIGNSISTDANGNVFVTGSFNGPSVIFDMDTLTNTYAFNTDIYVVKYDSSGNVVWATSAGGTSNDIGYRISNGGNGNVFLTGSFNSPFIIFGTDTLTNTSAPNSDIFAVKYDSSGNVVWATSAGGPYNDIGYGISNDGNGNAFMTGYFSNSSITFGSFTLTNAGGRDIFVVKYDPLGNVLWAASMGGASDDIGYSISAEANGNVYVSGSMYSGTLTFGSITVAPPSGSIDPMFIVKYDSNGNALCASALASGGDDQNAVSADGFGNAYITGDFAVITFIVGSDTLILTGSENTFTAKWNCQYMESVNEFNFEKAINLFPNPTTNELRIENAELRIREIAIYNTLGEKVFAQQQTTNDKQQTVNIGQLLTGVYFVAVADDKGNKITRKFIKM